MESDISDIFYTKNRFEKYFSNLAKLSSENPPPGKNAASGKFRDVVVCDPELFHLGDEADGSLSKDGRAFFSIYIDFYRTVQNGFKNCKNYSAQWYRHSRIMWNNFSNMEGLAKDIASSFLPLISGGVDSLIKILLDSVQETYKSVEKSDLVWSGEHANGWISVEVHKASKNGIEQIDALFPNNNDVTIKTVRKIFELLAELDTKNHKPWLTADWQISFQMICQVWSLDLSNL